MPAADFQSEPVAHDPVEVAKSVLRAEKAVCNEPDEIYFLFSAIEPWSVWHIRVDTRSFSIWSIQKTALGMSIPKRFRR